MSPNGVDIIEVGPRDGLQNQKHILSPHIRSQFIDLLFQAGLGTIEAGSFVRADRIPQLADSETVAAMLAKERLNDSIFLVPNLKGYDRAKKAGVRHLAIFVAATEAFSQNNIGMSLDESLQAATAVMAQAKADNQTGTLRVRGYVSVVFGCPFTGKPKIENTVKMVKALLDLGCWQVSIGDTLGVARPKDVDTVLSVLAQEVNFERLAMHFHDTYGMAIANIGQSLDWGIRSFDASAGGLGGCPYAPGAAGNVATEDVVYFTQGQGLNTGISLEKVAQASLFLQSHMPSVESPSRVLKALKSQGKV